jgi:hypothetical protein
MYRLYLNDKDFPISINFNGKPLKFSELKVLTEPFWPNTQGPLEGAPAIEWVRNFEFSTSKNHVIRGRVALLEKMSRDVSGFFLHFKGKGMGGIGAGEIQDDEFTTTDLKDNREYYRPQSIFGQEGSYRYQRFTGEFDITELGKTSSTDSIKWNEDEQQEFLLALEGFLKDKDFNMWAMAENYQSRRAKKLLSDTTNSDGVEFSIKEINEISNRFLESIRPEVISHDEEENSTIPGVVSGLISVPEEEFLVAEAAWRIRDSAGHLHSITPEFIEDGRLELFNLQSINSIEHNLKINLGHPFVRRFQWGNKDVRVALISMIYLMALPEVLLPLRCSNSAFKNKIFEIVESTLQITLEAI